MSSTEKSHLVGAGHRSSFFSQNDAVADRKSTFQLSSYFRSQGVNKEQLLLAISVICLMIATAGERVTFKMAVDRMVPFRFVLIQLIFMISAIVFGIITHIKQGFTNQITVRMKEFPHSKLLIMALLDTIQFAGLAISAAGVSPAMTVILLHTSTPFLVIGSRYAFPDRKYSLLQMSGVQLISLAVLICLIGSFTHKHHGSDKTASSFLYVGMAALHGLSTLYKEKSIIEWSQPIDIHYLSSWLFLYQFGVALVLAPFIYMLQGISSFWGGFPLDSFFDNVGDGLSCFLGNNPSGFTRYDSAYASCDHSYLLVLGYVISNVVVLECIDRVLQSSNQILGRVMAAAVFVAFLALRIYDTNGLGSSDVDFLSIISIIVLIAGMEIYGRDPEPDIEAVTTFSP